MAYPEFSLEAPFHQEGKDLVMCHHIFCLRQNYKEQLDNACLVRPADVIDDLDIKLIELLQKDSSTPAVKIAEMLKVTEGTVRNRVRNLRRLGVIRRFTISINPMALKQGTIAFILLNAAPGRVAEVARRLSLLEALAEVHETHTYGDLLLKVRAKTPSDLADIIATRIKTLPGVAGTQVITVLNAWKDA